MHDFKAGAIPDSLEWMITIKVVAEPTCYHYKSFLSWDVPLDSNPKKAFPYPGGAPKDPQKPQQFKKKAPTIEKNAQKFKGWSSFPKKSNPKILIIDGERYFDIPPVTIPTRLLRVSPLFDTVGITDAFRINHLVRSLFPGTS